MLVIITDRHHPQGGSQTNCEFIPVKPPDGLPQEVKVWQIISPQEVKPVRPSDVAQSIRQGARLGWQPQLPGITFEVPIAGLFVEKI